MENKDLSKLSQEELIALIQKEREATSVVIGELQTKTQDAEKVAAAAVSSSPRVIVAIGKDSYSVNAPKFSFDGQEYKAEDLKENKELAASLLKAKAGFLVKI